MPLLAECNLGDGTGLGFDDIAYVSDEDIEGSDRPWQSYIKSVSGATYSTLKTYGGLFQPTYGTIAFAPTMFDTITPEMQGAQHGDTSIPDPIIRWPPPERMNIELYWTDGTVADRIHLFSGIAHIKAILETEVQYGLYTAAPTTIIDTDGAAFSSTLANEIQTFCTAVGIDYDGTYARSPSPSVDFTVSGTNYILLRVLDDMAAYFCHMLNLVPNPIGSTNPFTLELIDMLEDVGTDLTLDGHEILKGRAYTYPTPVSECRCNFDDAVYSGGTDVGEWYGRIENVSPPFSPDEDIETHLSNIYGIITKPQFQLKIPMTMESLWPGRKIIWTDAGMTRSNISLQFYLNVRKLNYTFGKKPSVVISGDGGLVTI